MLILFIYIHDMFMFVHVHVVHECMYNIEGIHLRYA